MTRLNRFLSLDVETGRFMTLFYGELNLRERKLTYVRAGHNEPLIHRKAKNTFDELNEGGIALAMMEDFEFESAGPVQLDKGDTLFLYSDGLVEAMNAAREPFGVGRVKEILSATADLPAKDVVERIRRAVRDFTGVDAREDDLTLVVAKITG